ncbi:Lamin-B receptor-like Protein [Tribolium castaneum]|uniref:Lamin-B receptor-like Protein n=1 Tax=Tribolium castaneum TaxID=7070 RepID=D2A2U2_TRICA|nr:Lamin-B receptor-like Protein [Tribolium castaneum]
MKNHTKNETSSRTILLLLSMIGFLMFSLTLCANYLQEKSINSKNLYSIFIDYNAFLYYTIYLVFMALTFTEKYDKFSGTKSLIMSLIVFFALEICNFHAVDYLLEHLVHMAFAGLVLGNCLGLFCYVRSLNLPEDKINPKVIGQDMIYSYLIGREIRPRFFGYIDLKMFVNRVGVASAVLLNCALLYQEFTKSSTLNKSFALIEIMHLIYCADAVVTEYTFEYSLEVQKEGFGYICSVGYFIYPFLMNIFPYHILVSRTELPTWKLVVITLSFMVGYLLYRGSNNQKYDFKVNPSTPGVKFIDTHSENRKLLCSGFWGFVRHPNYLGDILMQLAFAGLTMCIPAIMPLTDIFFLIHRSVRDNELCKEKYGNSWDKYCEKVKYVIIPGIY